jgi:hypothetical protein
MSAITMTADACQPVVLLLYMLCQGCLCVFAAGAAGLAFMRVLADGAIDAAKPIKEGLSDQHVANLLAATQAQEVRAARPSRPAICW